MVKRRLGFALATSSFAALAVVACRSVLGIEDIDPASGSAIDASTDGSAAHGEGGSDAGHVDAAVDAGTKPFVSQCAGGDGCPRCCRDTYSAGIQKLEQASRSGGCLCAAKCATECAPTRCAVPPVLDGMPNAGCGECYDHSLIDRQPPGTKACADARDSCGKASVECDEAVKCLQGCFVDDP